MKISRQTTPMTPVAYRSGESLNFRDEAGKVVRVNSHCLALSYKMNFYEECDFADDVYYPGDSITITF
jgi:hypothetical protein